MPETPIARFRVAAAFALAALVGCGGAFAFGPQESRTAEPAAAPASSQETASGEPRAVAGEPQGPGTAGPTASTAPPAPWQVLDEHPGRGEQCLVCGQRIFEIPVVEVRYKGRRFHVAGPMLPEFQADPDLYFEKLQARSALFDERAVAPREMSGGWLGLGVYVLIGLVFAAACGYLAVARARAPLPWFFAGLIGNVIALAALVATPRGDASRLPAGVPPGLAKVPTTRSPVACPACGTANHPAAAACGECGGRLEPAVESETARV